MMRGRVRRGRCRSLDSLRSLGMTAGSLRSLGMTAVLRSRPEPPPGEPRRADWGASQAPENRRRLGEDTGIRRHPGTQERLERPLSNFIDVNPFVADENFGDAAIGWVIGRIAGSLQRAKIQASISGRRSAPSGSGYIERWPTRCSFLVSRFSFRIATEIE